MTVQADQESVTTLPAPLLGGNPTRSKTRLSLPSRGNKVVTEKVARYFIAVPTNPRGWRDYTHIVKLIIPKESLCTFMEKTLQPSVRVLGL